MKMTINAIPVMLITILCLHPNVYALANNHIFKKINPVWPVVKVVLIVLTILIVSNAHQLMT